MALAQLELFTSPQGPARKFLVLNVENFDQNTLCRALVSLNVGMVIDLRLRSVFDPPRYSHLAILKYFTQRNIRFLQFPLLQKKMDRGEISIFDQLENRRVFASSSYAVVALVDCDERSRINAQKLRQLFSRLRVPIVEALASSALHR